MSVNWHSWNFSWWCGFNCNKRPFMPVFYNAP